MYGKLLAQHPAKDRKLLAPFSSGQFLSATLIRLLKKHVQWKFFKNLLNIFNFRVTKCFLSTYYMTSIMLNLYS